MANGVNQREADVLSAFTKCLASISERDPDIIVHSGDFFHLVRPGNLAIVNAYQKLTKIQKKRNGKPFIIIAGNHDTPQNLDLGNILDLFKAIEGVSVFLARAGIAEFSALDLEVLSVPSSSLARKENVAWAPQSSRKHSILILHGMESEIAATLKSEGDFEFKSTCPERWSYVALGDVHTHHAFAPNACYAGATEYTSSNMWLEVGKPKGWVYFDTSVGQLEFVPIATRPAYDLRWIDATGLTAADLEPLLVEGAKWPRGEMPIVRQVVTNIARETYNRLGIEWRQEILGRCLHYQLDVRRAVEAFSSRSGDGTGLTLEMEWSQHIESALIPPGMDRKRISETGALMLKEVEVDEVDPA